MSEVRSPMLTSGCFVMWGCSLRSTFHISKCSLDLTEPKSVDVGGMAWNRRWGQNQRCWENTPPSRMWGTPRTGPPEQRWVKVRSLIVLIPSCCSHPMPGERGTENMVLLPGFVYLSLCCRLQDRLSTSGTPVCTMRKFPLPYFWFTVARNSLGSFLCFSKRFQNLNLFFLLRNLEHMPHCFG